MPSSAWKKKIIFFFFFFLFFFFFFFFFFNDTATTEIYTSWYTLSLHDALPILTNKKEDTFLIIMNFNLNDFFICNPPFYKKAYCFFYEFMSHINSIITPLFRTKNNSKSASPPYCNISPQYISIFHLYNSTDFFDLSTKIFLFCEVFL